ncbi:MAG: DUF4860 domain-containing protein [Agathobacter sp.]|nr:DUF4860 domain-containing protein [Agathobacter sp.]
MLHINNPLKRVDTVFVFLLFSLFAFTAFVLIIIGVKQYENTAASMDHNYQVRTINSYLREKVRQNDILSDITTFEVDGTNVLSLSTEIEGNQYYTLIYCYDGFLMEQLVSEDAVYSLSSGQKLIELDSIEIEVNPSGYLKAVYTASNGEVSNVYISIKSTR